MFTLQIMWTWITAQVHETSHQVTRSERGATTLEWVLIAAGVALMALAAVAIIRAKVMGKANSIPTG